MPITSNPLANNPSRRDLISQMERGEIQDLHLTPMERKTLVKQQKHVKYQQKTVENAESKATYKKLGIAVGATLLLTGV